MNINIISDFYFILFCFKCAENDCVEILFIFYFLFIEMQNKNMLSFDITV